MLRFLIIPSLKSDYLKKCWRFSVSKSPLVKWHENGMVIRMSVRLQFNQMLVKKWSKTNDEKLKGMLKNNMKGRCYREPGIYMYDLLRYSIKR